MDRENGSRDRVLELGKLTPKDLARIRKCRRSYNRLGFAYQTGFVRLENRFPAQRPFEIVDDLLTFVSVQTEIPDEEIQQYTQRQQTISEHQQQIREYLSLQLFEDADQTEFDRYLFEECCRLEQTAVLRVRARVFLRTHQILEPGNRRGIVFTNQTNL